MTRAIAPLSGKARVAGLIGWPVAHSRSPRLHGYWIAEHGIDGAYVPLAVPPDHLEAAVRGLAAAGRSEEHTSELQSLMRISYAVSCLKKKTKELNRRMTRYKSK